MKIMWLFACRNRDCSRYKQERDGKGLCPGCGWLTTLASIKTER